MVCNGTRYILRWTRTGRWALTGFDAFLSGSGVVPCPIIGLDGVPWVGQARYTFVPLTGAGGRFPACPLRQRRDSTTPLVLLAVCVLQRAGVCVSSAARAFILWIFFFVAATQQRGRQGRKKKRLLSGNPKSFCFPSSSEWRGSTQREKRVCNKMRAKEN
jgi:hypothetical protein